MFYIFKKYPALLTKFSEKKDGSMKIVKNADLVRQNKKNRRAFQEKNRISEEKLVSAEIVHGNQIEIVGKSDSGKIVASVDGLITRENNLYLSITSADCLPIFLFDPEKEIIGIVHAGWRSLEKNILDNAVKNIYALGGKPKNILAGIGPSICQKHYEVGPEVAEKFVKYPKVIKIVDNRKFLDIKNIAELQLLELGLEVNNIEISPECTYELPDKYFSARRDKPKEEIEAMMAVIGMKK